MDTAQTRGGRHESQKRSLGGTLRIHMPPIRTSRPSSSRRRECVLMTRGEANSGESKCASVTGEPSPPERAASMPLDEMSPSSASQREAAFLPRLVGSCPRRVVLCFSRCVSHLAERRLEPDLAEPARRAALGRVRVLVEGVELRRVAAREQQQHDLAAGGGYG